MERENIDSYIITFMKAEKNTSGNKQTKEKNMKMMKKSNSKILVSASCFGYEVSWRGSRKSFSVVGRSLQISG